VNGYKKSSKSSENQEICSSMPDNRAIKRRGQVVERGKEKWTKTMNFPGRTPPARGQCPSKENGWNDLSLKKYPNNPRRTGKRRNRGTKKRDKRNHWNARLREMDHVGFAAGVR